MNELEHRDKREQAQQALTEAVGQGRLDLGEFTEMVGVVWSTDDPATLDRFIAEAHPGFHDTRQAELEQRAEPGAAPTPTPFHRHPVAAVGPQQLSSFLGDITREGEWLVPEHLSVRTIVGDLYLDLRRATAASPIVTIRVDTFLGDIRLVVPPGVQVDVQVNSILGDSKVTTSEPLPGAPRVVLTGTSILGDIKVTTRKVDEKPSFWWRWL